MLLAASAWHGRQLPKMSQKAVRSAVHTPAAAKTASKELKIKGKSLVLTAALDFVWMQPNEE